MSDFKLIKIDENTVEGKSEDNKCLMESGQYSDFLKADFKVIVSRNSAKTAYNAVVDSRLKATGGGWWWSGYRTISAVVSWVENGETKSQSKSYAYAHNESRIDIPEGDDDTVVTTDWLSDNLQFNNIAKSGIDTLKISITIDCTPTLGSYCNDIGYTNALGPCTKAGGIATNGHDHFQYFKVVAKDFPLTDIPLVTAPTIGSLENSNKYNNQAGISAATNSISFKWAKTAGSDIVGSEIRYKKSSDSSYSNWINTSSVATTYYIINLTAGTTYNIQVRSYNAAGYSNILSGTIRTRHNAPVTTLTLESRDLEALTFKWTSDKSLEYTYYKVDSGNWISLKQTGTSNTFRIDGFNPKTTHTISFYGKSYATHDALDSSSISASGTTYDIAHITSISDCIFGATTNVVIASESSKTLKLKVQTTGNSNTALFETELNKGTYVFNPSQELLDKMYKCYSNANTVPITFQIITKGTKDWEDTVQSKTLTLTGIAKTARIGVNNAPRRANGFIGINETARRAVFWVGDSDNKPRRCT